MINLNIDSDVNTKPFQEGILANALDKAADIDVQKIKKDWQDSDKGIIDKARTLNDEGLEKGKEQIDAIDRVRSKHTVDTRSIIARARNSVLQFPIYVPQHIRANEAHIIAKMFERVYTTLVQTVLSQNPIMDEEEANNLVFLKKFHTNLKEAADVLVNKYYEPIDEIDAMMCESVFFEQKLTENCTVRFSVVPCTDKDIIMENARLINEPLTGLAYLHEAADDDKKKKSGPPAGKQETKESNVSERVMSPQDLEDMAASRSLSASERRLAKKPESEIRKEVEEQLAQQQPIEVSKVDKDGKDRPKDEVDAERKELEADRKSKQKAIVNRRLEEKRKAEKKLDKAVNQLKNDIKAKKVADCRYLDGKYILASRTAKTVHSPAKKEKTVVDDAVRAPQILRDADIKKINGLTPYTIEAEFQLRTKSGINRNVRYIIGIKSVLHQFRTQDLADDLRELVTGNVKSLQKVRYKTGEIKFKDYFFNIKGLKSDAAKHVNYDKRWLNTLKRLADYNKMNGTLLKKPVEAIAGGNVPIPNGTMVLSQTDVTALTNQTGIDLSVVSNAKRLAKSLFLIAVVIVDSTEGTMRVLFPDSDNEWDVQSLAAIDSELAKTDNSQLMRELNHMVNK